MLAGLEEATGPGAPDLGNVDSIDLRLAACFYVFCLVKNNGFAAPDSAEAMVFAAHDSAKPMVLQVLTR